jgi:hypothetical protein
MLRHNKSVRQNGAQEQRAIYQSRAAQVGREGSSVKRVLSYFLFSNNHPTFPAVPPKAGQNRTVEVRLFARIVQGDDFPQVHLMS